MNLKNHKIESFSRFVFLLSALLFVSPLAAQTQTTKLEPGKNLERQIKGGETQSFQVDVKSGFYARIEVEQKNIDVVVSLYAPDGKAIAEMDGNYGLLWRESVSCVADADEIYRIEIKAFGTKYNAGGYKIKFSELRQSIARDRRRIEAEQFLTKGKKLDEQNDRKAEALKNYEASLNIWREIKDSYWEGVTLLHQGWTYQDLQKNEEAVIVGTQALDIFNSINDRVGKAKAINSLGRSYTGLKQYARARDFFEDALIIRRELKDLRGEGNTLFNLLPVYSGLQQPEKRLESLKKLLSIRRKSKSRVEESRTLYLLGVHYHDLRQYEKARDYYEQGLQIDRELKDRSGESDYLFNLGKLFIGLYQYEKAQDYFERALSIKRELKDRAGEGEMLKTLSITYGNLNRYEKALDAARQALFIKRDSKDRAGEGDALGNLALIHSGVSQYEKALDFYEQALTIKRELKDRAGEGKTLLFIGSIYRSLSQYEKAENYLEQGLAIVREANDRNYQILALYFLAVIHSSSDQTEKAVNYCEQALALAREMKDEATEANMLGCLAQTYQNFNQYDKSKEYYKLNLAIVRKLKLSINEFNVLNGLGLLAIFQSDFDRARHYFEQTLKNARQRKDRRGKQTSLENLAIVYLQIGKVEKAKELREQSLAIAREVKDRYFEGAALSGLGSIYYSLSRYEKALEFYEQALTVQRETKNRSGEGGTLGSLGKIYLAMGQYEKAREFSEQGLAIARETRARLNEYSSLTDLGFIYLNLDRYEKARDYLEQGLAVSKELKTQIVGSDSFVGLGSMSADFNRNDKAQDFYLQSLSIVKEIKNRAGEGNMLNNLGTVYLNLKKYEQAQKYFEQALEIAKEVKNKHNEALAMTNLAETVLRLNQFEKARSFYEQSLALAEEVKSHRLVGSALNGLGDAYFKLNQNDKARDFYEQALSVAREVKSKKLEGKILWSLMELFKKLEKSSSAIVYGKQTINIYQEIRGSIKGFDKDLQTGYLKDKEEAYRTLADLLISNNRFPEAQAVLDLIKGKEYEQLTRTGETAQHIPYSQSEAEVVAKIDRLVALGREQTELRRQQKEQGEQFPADKLKRLEQLNSDIKLANNEFENALASLAKADTSVETRTLEIQGEKNLQSALLNIGKELNTGAVAIYTVIGSEEEKDANGKVLTDKTRSKFGWVILVTSKDRKAYPIDVADLERNVFQFRTALSSDKYDPKPLAQKIYNAIFRQTSDKQKVTLEQDLNDILGKYPDKTLMWSLDGVLRYIPMAALNDGNSYLVEKYRNVVFTKESLLWLMNSPKSNPQILGLGVSAGNKDLNMSALPGVEKELTDVVRQSKETTGILDGIRKLNSAFKKQDILNLKDEENQFQTVHIASHYSFNPADQNSSYLLIGDGNGKLTFGDMKTENNLFGTVDLLTLSACDTGVSGNGKEAEGFAYLAQSLGAKSVIASLWKVSDAGTPELMLRFYKLRAEHPEMSKGEAFRQAQISLLNAGKTSSNAAQTGKNTRAELVGGGSENSNPPLFVKDSKNPFSHPHYWSSFVLIGNWR